MKRVNTILMAVPFLVLFASASSFSEEEVVGKVVSMDRGHITVKKTDGETRRFGWSKKTRLFNEGAPIHVRRILPGTLVRVAPYDGEAEAIFLLEVPR